MMFETIKSTDDNRLQNMAIRLEPMLSLPSYQRESDGQALAL